MYKSVYKGEDLLGEVEIYPTVNENNKNVLDELKEIRISYFSQPSERCPPVAVLHTINSSNGVCFKLMESKTSPLSSPDTPLFLLHSSMTQENKTAVMPLGGEELHLVAMQSRNGGKQCPCFWGFYVASGLYNSCLVMLNLRCLGIVFDLDETLIVANTMRSFEDRIEALQRKISTEVDPQRISGMLAEIKRYQDDKFILKQYAENDQVADNGRVVKTQSEVVPALSDNHQPIIRPLIRLHEKNIILTRINPQIRDTSVLVRLRPAWEDLRSYLTARGRKRFEVYVCTMAERDYALEMWRLLDPDSNLINSNKLLDRIVCVKSGSRKSLFNVFQESLCHPKMALVIDDRLKVWDDRDQPRVHVVPAFAPYYAPQAEGNNTVPVLCVARNVACNVRGGFFKEFDDSLLQKIPEIFYEDDIKDVPSPDVSNHLVSEDDTSAVNGNRDPLAFDGMADAEVERRLKEATSAALTASLVVTNIDQRLASLQYSMAPSSSTTSLPSSQQSAMTFPNMQFPQAASVVKPLGHLGAAEPSLHSSPAREEGEVPESELDPDTRRRLLILQHGQDTREPPPSEPPFAARPPVQASVPRVQPHPGWFPVEEEMSPRQLSRMVPKELPLDPDPMQIEKHRPHHSSFFSKVDNSIPSDRILQDNQRFPKEAFHRDDRLRFNHASAGYHSVSGEEIPLSRSSSMNRDVDFESGRAISNAETPAGALQEIAMKCGAKVEFRPALVASTELQFYVEAWFAGEKIGEGSGKTRREAHFQAAEGSLKNLANIYLSRVKLDSVPVNGEMSKFSNVNNNGFVGNANSFGIQSFPKEESLSSSTSSEPSRPLDPRLEGFQKSMNSVSALKELCMMEGLGGVVFQPRPPPSANSVEKDEVHVQVEIDGEVLGKGIGLTWDEAKMQAAEKALGSLRSTLFAQKRQVSPRSFQGMPNKRMKQEFPQVLQRMPSSARYPKNAPPVP
ncbi:RNA polymerase II C-terminal domain phosphatase-like 1 [Pyrus ussuriensis x Pyrus communis]|uniref:protein-serine/threonine phosphatase n=1 Tax=Pyrus ussuriensis x Pyrus communis TaxID=2448454 RepID=A0A5N5IIM6_9ROSA|nr:RNA polymerase II C-terminal domain phosphatase-like 1 [Pyrus ussuriensis x Pyrus communis]